MYEDQTCPTPTGRCADLDFRLCVYEAGHALTARALGFEVLSVTMRPRPPVLESDKVLRGGSIRALTDLLANRVIELFGGQIAEGHACQTSSCCTGDVARIDELCRLIAGLEGHGKPEDVWFELEDVALDFFDSPKMRDAIVPLAEFLLGWVQAGEGIVPGAEVEAKMDELVPPRPQKKAKGLGRLFVRA